MRGRNVLVVGCIYPDERMMHRGTFVHQWARQLQMLGFGVEALKRDHITLATYFSSPRRVMDFYRKPRVFSYEWEGVRVHRIGIHMALPLDYSKAAPRITYNAVKPEIQRIRERFPFDLIDLATWGDLSLAVSRVAREMGIPYIANAIGAHDNDYYDKPRSLYYQFHREIYENARFVICVSEDLNRKVRIMTDGRAKTFTFYSGVDTEAFSKKPELREECRRRLGYGEREKVILFVGRQERTKGIYELVDAFGRLARSEPALRLLLVGDAWERAGLRRAIRAAGIGPRVTIHDAVGHREIPGFMNAADVFVLPSWMEGVPNVVMEASACELPVVATRVGGVPEAIEEGVTGLLVEPKSPQDLAAKIAEALRSPEGAARMGKAAREKMVARFNYHNNGLLLAERIERIFQKETGG